MRSWHTNLPVNVTGMHWNHRRPIQHLDRYIRSFSIFFLISTPSIKILYPSSTINALSIGLLILALTSLFMSGQLRLPTLLFLWWTLFSGLLITTGLRDYGDLEVVSRYAILVFSVYAIISISGRDITTLVCRLIFFWGFMIAAWQILGEVPTDRALGQTYLTVAMPIGAATTLAMTSVARSDLPHLARFAYAVSALAMLYSLSTLLGRAALLFSILSFMLSVSFFVFFTPSSAKTKITAFIIMSVAACAIALTALTFGLRQMGRLYNLVNSTHEEPRLQIYYKALEYIRDNPLVGYGFGSSFRLFEAYPHNIFLEVMLHGGLILLSVFLLVFVMYVRSIYRTVSSSRQIDIFACLLSLSLFLLFQWNVSFDFATAYIPLSGVLLFIIAATDHSKNKGDKIGV